MPSKISVEHKASRPYLNLPFQASKSSFCHHSPLFIHSSLASNTSSLYFHNTALFISCASNFSGQPHISSAYNPFSINSCCDAKTQLRSNSWPQCASYPPRCHSKNTKVRMYRSAHDDGRSVSEICSKSYSITLATNRAYAKKFDKISPIHPRRNVHAATRYCPSRCNASLISSYKALQSTSNAVQSSAGTR